MENDEHLVILRRGVEEWNAWRRSEPELVPYLIRADLRQANLNGANLFRAILVHANLSEANLSGVDLHQANLFGAKLNGANLNGANLDGADLSGADLRDASLSGASLDGASLDAANLSQANLVAADLSGASLSRAILSGANLYQAKLFDADLDGANLSRADLSNVVLYRANLSGANLKGLLSGHTVWGDIDLSGTKGLETSKHVGNSTVGLDTIKQSKGEIPGDFLRGCGLSDRDIAVARTPIWRPRWVDAAPWRYPVWLACSEALEEFSSEARLGTLGGEREQVGDMLGRLIGAMGKYSARSTGPRGCRVSVSRYVFKTKEEDLCGPDFALLFAYQDTAGVSVARFVLFQGKLIKHGSVRISNLQLDQLLRSSWHGSFYIAWDADTGGTPGDSPRCVHAPILAQFVRAKTTKSGTAPSIPWPTVRPYADEFADLLADRFLCGELGDPLECSPGDDGSELARRLLHVAGLPRVDVVVFKVRPESGFDGPAMCVDQEAHVIHLDDQHDDDDR
jgi:uncharacterized protein YjbI with pentapeptide repeats